METFGNGNIWNNSAFNTFTMSRSRSVSPWLWLESLTWRETSHGLLTSVALKYCYRILIQKNLAENQSCLASYTLESLLNENKRAKILNISLTYHAMQN